MYNWLRYEKMIIHKSISFLAKKCLLVFWKLGEKGSSPIFYMFFNRCGLLSLLILFRGSLCKHSFQWHQGEAEGALAWIKSLMDYSWLDRAWPCDPASPSTCLASVASQAAKQEQVGKCLTTGRELATLLSTRTL